MPGGCGSSAGVAVGAAAGAGAAPPEGCEAGGVLCGAGAAGGDVCDHAIVVEKVRAAAILPNSPLLMVLRTSDQCCFRAVQRGSLPTNM